MKVSDFSNKDYEIRNRHKLDHILLELCHQVIQGQLDNPKKYGLVGACVLDPKNRKVFGVNQAVGDGKRKHAERVAIDRYVEQYGEIPHGSIILTTLSPCNENSTHMADERYGESCTDLVNNSDCRKVYCGYMDPSQHNEHAEYTLEETGNTRIKNLCKSFADVFLKKSINESQRFTTMQQVKDYFKRIGKTEAQAAAAWSRGYRGPKTKEIAPYDPDKNKNFWYNKDVDETINPDIFQGSWKKTEHRDGLDLKAEASKKGLSIRAYDVTGRLIGQAHFDIEGEQLRSFDTHVDPSYRRQGVATAMYNWAKELGNDIAASSERTPDGRKFWRGSRNGTKIWENMIGAPKAREFIDQVYSQYPDWPYGQADKVMVWGEGEDQQFAAFKLKPGTGANSVEIDWIMAGPEQRKGVGSRAIQELQRQARAAGIRLTLYPWSHGQISPASLTRFYKRHGFKPITKGAKPMSWEPVDEVAIDNYNGAGSTPNNQNIDYMGLRVLMRPSTFLQLAAPLSSAPNAKLEKYIADGGAIGAPFLRIDIPEGWNTGDFAMPAQVAGHEGRNRMHAIRKLEGDDPIEVHIFPIYYRARDMTPEFVKNLNSRLQVEHSSVIKSGPLFTPLPASIAETFADDEVIDEAPLPSDWDPEQMKKGTTFKSRLAYALQRAKKLGTGSSRVAMTIEYEGRPTVLKVAKNKRGLGQNAAEANILSDGYAKQLGILIPLIDYDNKNTEPYWIHTEMAQKVNDKQLCSLLKCDDNLEELVRIARTISGTTKYPVNLTKLALDYSLRGKSKHDIDTLFEYGETIAELILSYDIMPGDLIASVNWGIYQGKPVIIDIGLDNNVWRQHYLKIKP
jgi:pyrimidine deaminase RibD-like protein/GNAT superfamily N-acetyltransferase